LRHDRCDIKSTDFEYKPVVVRIIDRQSTMMLFIVVSKHNHVLGLLASMAWDRIVYGWVLRNLAPSSFWKYRWHQSLLSLDHATLLLYIS